MTAAVGIALSFVIVYNVMFFAARNNKTTAVGQKQLQTAHTPVRAEREKHLPPDTVEKHADKQDRSRWKRDPFSLQQSSDNPIIVADVKLMGIIMRNGKGHALINGSVYGVNDRIGSSRIKEIRQHNIVLLTDGGTEELSFEDYHVLKEKTK
jgi:hypothetical protein